MQIRHLAPFANLPRLPLPVNLKAELHNLYCYKWTFIANTRALQIDVKTQFGSMQTRREPSFFTLIVMDEHQSV